MFHFLFRLCSIVFPILLYCSKLDFSLARDSPRACTEVFQKPDQVLKSGNGCAGDTVIPIDLLDGRQFPAAAFLPVE